MNTNQSVTDKQKENNPFEDVTIINVISGKGGTGKTCFTNVLADELGKSHHHQVLVIDLDVPVRGTTSLIKLTNNGALNLVEDGKSVTSFFKAYNDAVVKEVISVQSKGSPQPQIDKRREECLAQFASVKVSISQFHSYYILPSADTLVGADISYSSFWHWSNKDVSEALEALITSALKSSPLKKKTFDYVFLDNRAGYDLFVAEAHKISDFSILVQEDDNVSNSTADELYEQLRNRERVDKGEARTQILRVRNKVLPSKLMKDHSNLLYTSDIPFDMDVMRIFGEPRFWSRIRGTLYHRAVIKAWNCIDAKIGLNSYLRDIGSLSLTFRAGSKFPVLPSFGRILFMFGLLLTFVAFGLLFTLVYGGITAQEMAVRLNFPVTPLLLSFAGLGMFLTLISVLFIGAKRERPKNKREQDDFTDYPY